MINGLDQCRVKEPTALLHNILNSLSQIFCCSHTLKKSLLQVLLIKRLIHSLNVLFQEQNSNKQQYKISNKITWIYKVQVIKPRNPPGVNFTFLLLYFNIFKERGAPNLTTD